MQCGLSLGSNLGDRIKSLSTARDSIIALDDISLVAQSRVYETEPVDAANRFAQQLGGYKDIDASGRTPVEITVSLLDIPSGEMRIEHVFRPGEVEKAAAQ